MYHSIELKEGALIVADAHYSHKRPELLAFLKEIHAQSIPATQLFLMGDIFDALFGEIPYTHIQNQEAIGLINKIAQRIEVFYFEGNHDFNLASIFLNVKIFPIEHQPVACSYESKKILLAHGDIDGDFGYKIYAKVIRNRILLHLLSFLDTFFGHAILKRLDAYLSRKDDCREFVGLKQFIQKRLGTKYSCDYFVEGHFHQNKTIQMDDFVYINLGAFACNQRYFVVESSQNRELFEQKNFLKGI
ncbi:MAG: metallophosphoesterase [Sulfurimonas sp.]|uniref:UDP-2,3-diacylglucosamine diphosphatase n=1 Tax=Sulfurimonas sp. TaxID=2022749 RepID=UPI00263307AF|nr:metallophosphoesterase [Sulfurimonas sp.]MDD2652664.1 metallophosphoesterase [Sulfurimonas sp.]MDD3450831.1 metallophosphoesterase [Sulfurimonas sp.]